MHRTRILLPADKNLRARVFELTTLLALSYHDYRIEDWNIYVRLGTWFQVDGIVRDDGKFLVEAKCYRSPYRLGKRDRKRLEIAERLDLSGVIFVSSSCFSGSLRDGVKVLMLCWRDLSNLPIGTFTALFDKIELRGRHVVYVDLGVKVELPRSVEASEFVACSGLYKIETDVEVWIRRLAYIVRVRGSAPKRVPNSLDELHEYDFRERGTELSILEAWMLEDSLKGFAARTPRALVDTLRVCASLGEMFDARSVQRLLRDLGHTTGITGVRNSLRNLEILSFLRAERRSGRTYYRPTRLLIEWKKADDRRKMEIFAEAIKRYLPIRYVVDAYRRGMRDEYSIAEHFRRQYRPYFPYAICNMNPNKVYGLLLLAKFAGLID